MTTDQGSRSGGYRPGARSGMGPRDKKGRPRFVPRRKVCSFCVDKVKAIDYKNVDLLKRYLSDRGRIEPRRKTGTCAHHQRMLAESLKRARHLALLPYTLTHVLASGMELGPQRRPFIRRDERDFRGERPVVAPAERAAPPPAARPVEVKVEQAATAAPEAESPATPAAEAVAPAPTTEKAEKPKAPRAAKAKAAKTE